jgi:hypothetical protein
MKRYLPGVVLLFVVSAGLRAQRHGRADSVQNYRRGITLTPPELVLDPGTNQKKLRFTFARLQHMTRSTVEVTDCSNKRIGRFEGVDVSQLILEKGPQLGVLEVSYGFFRKKKLSGSQLNPDSRVIVADTVDGKPFSGSAPFRLIIDPGHGQMQLFSHVRRVSIKSPP